MNDDFSSRNNVYAALQRECLLQPQRRTKTIKIMFAVELKYLLQEERKALLRKQAAAQSGRCGKLLCLPAFLLPLLERLQLPVLSQMPTCSAFIRPSCICFFDWLPASYLVNAKRLRTNERMERN